MVIDYGFVKDLGDTTAHGCVLKQIDRAVKERIAQAAEFAQASAEPDPAELYTDVLIEPSLPAADGTRA